MLASFFFLNPMTAIVGGALIASPIIIHLINRMRYKRIRWAAMEFLLKAQKKSRRRMIIEQLLLLLLRILLVAAVAFLLARLIQKKDDPAQAEDPLKAKDPPPVTRHVVLLDDSASMADRWQQTDGPERGQEIQPIQKARKVVIDAIIDAVKDDNNPHEFVFIRTGSPDKRRPAELLTNESRDRFEKFLKEEYKPTDFHDNLPAALDAAKTECAEAEKDQKRNLIVHLVSDFRSSDWNDSTRDLLATFFTHFDKAKVQFKLHDVSAPKRDANRELPLNENLAITDFRPETRVAIKDQPIDFSVTVANHGDSVKQNVRVNIRVNNEERLDGSINFRAIPPHSSVTERVTFALNRVAPKDAKDKEETARFDGFNLLSAHLENQYSGLAVDDVRYAVVEVREKIGILLVDNETKSRTLVRENGRDEYTITRDAEAYYLWKLFRDNFTTFNVSVRTVGELEKMNLSPYSAIVFCNVETLETRVPKGTEKLDPLDAPVLKKVEAFLANGGGVAFFMGPAVRNPSYYNEVLWRDGSGMFPLPLKEIANKNATPEQLNQIQFDQRMSFYKKLVVRNDMRRHPALERLYSDSRAGKVLDQSYENSFYGVSFPRYYVVDRPRWSPRPDTQVLLYLANNRSVADYERQTRDLTNKLRALMDERARLAPLEQRLTETTDEVKKREIQRQIDDVKAELAKYAKYKPKLMDYAERINNIVGKYDNPLHTLVFWLDQILLQDPGDEKSGVPSMVEFWQFPETDAVRQDLVRLVDMMKYGDPFYVAKQYRKGRVLAFMGGAGASGAEGGYWNPLNSASGQTYFPPLMKDSLQHYLCSGSTVATASNELTIPLGGLAGGMAMQVAEGVVSDFYLPLNKPFLFELDAAAYESTVDVNRVTNNTNPAVGEDKVKFAKLPVKNRPLAGERQLLWRFNEAPDAGVYLFEFTQKGMDAGASDIRALAYNFDPRIESDLRRARTEDVLNISGLPKFEDDDADEIKRISKETVRINEQESDLGYSKSHWLFLGLLVLLILEQAWAVRMSFHVKETANLSLPQAFSRGKIVT